jgi:hypothetical protein
MQHQSDQQIIRKQSPDNVRAMCHSLLPITVLASDGSETTREA